MATAKPIEPMVLTVMADPRLARLVRMTASNVAMLSSMSVDRIEDVRMAAEEAFIYACSVEANAQVSLTFSVDEAHVAIDVDLGLDDLPEADPESPAAYAGLILGAVCDVYETIQAPARIHLELKADV